MKIKNKDSLQWCVLNRRGIPTFTVHGVAGSLVLSNCFLNDLSVKNMSLWDSEDNF